MDTLRIAALADHRLADLRRAADAQRLAARARTTRAPSRWHLDLGARIDPVRRPRTTAPC